MTPTYRIDPHRPSRLRWLALAIPVAVIVVTALAYCGGMAK